MLSLLIGSMKLFFSKTVCHHFWPGLMAGEQTVGIATKIQCYIPPSPQKKKTLSLHVQPKGKSELMGHSYAL